MLNERPGSLGRPWHDPSVGLKITCGFQTDLANSATSMRLHSGNGYLHHVKVPLGLIRTSGVTSALLVTARKAAVIK